MTKVFETRSTIAICLAAALLAGCGSARSGSGGANGSCRLYATQATTVTGSTRYVSTCSFDRPTITMHCTSAPVSPPGTSSTNSTTWATIEDALASNHPIGKFTLAHTAYSAGPCSYTVDYLYDSSGRSTTLHVVLLPGSPADCAVPDEVTNTAWDALGRPTAGTFSVTRFSCNGTRTLSYDDVSRTVTLVKSACTGGSTGESALTSTSTYNADGLLLQGTTTINGMTSAIVETIGATAQICD